MIERLQYHHTVHALYHRVNMSSLLCGCDGCMSRGPYFQILGENPPQTSELNLWVRQQIKNELNYIELQNNLHLESLQQQIDLLLLKATVVKVYLIQMEQNPSSKLC